jgi:membrane fusion protein, multidrug efflux system
MRSNDPRMSCSQPGIAGPPHAFRPPGRSVLAFSLLAASCLFLLSLSACSRKKSDNPGDARKEMPIAVEVETVRLGPIESTLRTFATLEAEQEVKVLSRTGNRVVELLVEEGDEVAMDDLLVRLDDANQQVAVSRAENSLAKARQEFSRLEALYAQNLISEQVFTDGRFELRALELTLEDAQRDLAYTVIRAPIAGTVTRRLVKLGDLVGPNQHLFDLIDFKSLVARIYVPEKDLAQLAVDQKARVTATALAGQVFIGRIQRIAPVVESRSGTVKVTIGFHEPGPLRPGMYVDVELILDARADAVLLSKRALILDGDQTYAFRMSTNRRVERLLVHPRASDSFHVEPTTGFAEGDEVVVAGQTGLKNGALVRLPGDPDPGATNQVGATAARPTPQP